MFLRFFNAVKAAVVDVPKALLDRLPAGASLDLARGRKASDLRAVSHPLLPAAASSDRLGSELYSQAQGGDEASWRAYADWLQEREDAASRQRGAAIAVQAQGPLGLRFAPLPAGTFWMGGGGGKPGEKQVTIAEPFALAIYPVTQGQWRAVMGKNPSVFSRGSWDKVSGISDGDLALFPVECVLWIQVQEFL
jgi:formylglycine-generating enzyme required for sulfatase activity